MNVELDSIKVVNLRPGDVIVIRFETLPTLIHMDRLKDTLKDLFPGHKCLILGDGAKVDVVRPSEAPKE